MQFQWNCLGLGQGGDKWGAGEVLQGFAVDPGQQPETLMKGDLRTESGE